VDRRVAHDPLEALCRIDDATGVWVGVVDTPEVRLLGEVLVEALRAPHDRLRDQLRHAVAGSVVQTEDTRGIASRSAREHPPERDDLSHRFTAVFVSHVLNDPLAALHREIDVDVRHGDSLRVEEALEQKVVLQRVHIGDPERVGHDRPGCGTAPRTDRDSIVLRELHEVPDDEEVRREPHLLYDAQLHFQAFQG
jgi:hypothetical protein